MYDEIWLNAVLLIASQGRRNPMLVVGDFGFGAGVRTLPIYGVLAMLVRALPFCFVLFLGGPIDCAFEILS